MDKYTVRHFYSNPRNNFDESFTNKKEAIKCLKKMVSDDNGSVSILYAQEKEIARRYWTNKNIEWNK